MNDYTTKWSNQQMIDVEQEKWRNIASVYVWSGVELVWSSCWSNVAETNDRMSNAIKKNELRKFMYFKTFYCIPVAAFFSHYLAATRAASVFPLPRVVFVGRSKL